MIRTALAIALLLGARLVQASPPAEESYILHCAGCHRIDGSGSSAVPSFDALAEIVAAPGGRRYLVGVPGVAQAPLGDRELAALLDWLVREFAGQAPSPPFSAAEVARGRAEPLRSPGKVRAALLGGAKP